MVDFHTGHVGELRWSSFNSDAHSAGLIKWSYNPYPFGVDPAWHGSRSELPFLNSMKMKMSILMGITQMNLGVILSWWNAKFFHNKLDIWWGIMVWLVWRFRLGKFCFHNNTKASQLKLVHNDTESKSCNQEKKESEEETEVCYWACLWQVPVCSSAAVPQRSVWIPFNTYSCKVVSGKQSRSLPRHYLYVFESWERSWGRSTLLGSI